MRWVALLLPLLSVACERSIVLGSECPDFDGPCPNIGGGEDERDADSTQADGGGRDASSPAQPDGGENIDANVADASTASDASGDEGQAGDAGSVLFPGIHNPSFELPPDATTPYPLDPLSLQGMSWYGCRDGMDIVSEIHTTSGATVRPTEGATFFADGLSADFTQSGLMQQLSDPLKGGQAYAMLIDVWAEQGNLVGDIGLKLGSSLLQGPPLGCILSSFKELDVTGPIEPGAWRTFCLSFKPDRDISGITLLGYAAGPGNLLGITGAQLYIDNLRPVAGCAP